MSSTSEQLRVPAASGAEAGWGRDAKVIGLISAAHFTSHVHLMLLPPIFGPVKEAFGVSYTRSAWRSPPTTSFRRRCRRRPVSWSTASARAPC
jgi:hypothetical protein